MKLIGLLVFIAAPAHFAPTHPASEIIGVQMEVLRNAGKLSIGKATVAAITALPVFYKKRN